MLEHHEIIPRWRVTGVYELNDTGEVPARFDIREDNLFPCAPHLGRYLCVAVPGEIDEVETIIHDKEIHRLRLARLIAYPRDALLVEDRVEQG